MFSDIAIKVENLSKCYEVYDTPRDRLKQFIFPRMQSVVRIVDRQNYFREFWALRNVNFEVKKGETVGIIGCNGSGKSTLLQMICGTLNPTSGSINTKGRIAALLELGSGFNPEFTGRENVYLNGAVLGLSNKEIDERFDDIADFADIGEFIERPVKTYSSGMTVRLAFAVQAMVDPDILVVDEALAVGDEKFQRKCFARLEELKSKGSSILFVSHSSASIVELCDRTLLLDHGNQLVFGDSPSVVRIYQKILYASIDSRERFIRELLADEISSHNQDVNIEEKSECLNITIKTEAKKNKLNDAYDPGLIPETTTVYPSQGAIINGIRIINNNNEAVNILQSSNTYDFIVSGHFLKDFSGVYFGIHIKSVSGIEITGQRFPQEGLYLENVRAGQDFEMKFTFRMDLLPGVYFSGGGIWSSTEPHCAHRIVDAIMFRVNPGEAIHSFGYVDLREAEPVVKING
ncbi:ABC transporter [Aeromonas caviae]|uniref:ABC transporter ATP-binding protein n=1 Tax=Aeromonas TaxID=642 RepID=UPI000C3345A3|nr:MULTISPECIES: ABC transporter ATP-binding protein [Aeromonas]GKQ63220.1 ABC transporter [Aeromonas caviae]AXL05108.1 ABC transporter ATP-binding protein [Aeromonas hydrophila]AZU48796.1 ABC transporter ATP-binding protein [Aeromonas hydrophila]PKD26095.1 Teichoic acid export ATP-binding protein TagH [Aeromonas hydrophila]QBX70744.1 ABC transporter ATP-binding protein [Aeromonas hydrophila]